MLRTTVSEGTCRDCTISKLIELRNWNVLIIFVPLIASTHQVPYNGETNAYGFFFAMLERWLALRYEDQWKCGLHTYEHTIRVWLTWEAWNTCAPRSTRIIIREFATLFAKRRRIGVRDKHLSLSLLLSLSLSLSVSPRFNGPFAHRVGGIFLNRAIART